MITDDEIRRLKRAVLGKPRKTAADRKLLDDCDTALRPRDANARQLYGDAYMHNTEMARYRCADAWAFISKRSIRR